MKNYKFLLIGLMMSMTSYAQSPDVKTSLLQNAFGLYNISIEHMVGDTGFNFSFEYLDQSVFDGVNIASEDKRGPFTATFEYRDYYEAGRYYASGLYKGYYLRGRFYNESVAAGYIRGFKWVNSHWMVFEAHVGGGLSYPLGVDLNVSFSVGMRF